MSAISSCVRQFGVSDELQILQWQRRASIRKTQHAPLTHSLQLALPPTHSPSNSLSLQLIPPHSS